MNKLKITFYRNIRRNNKLEPAKSCKQFMLKKWRISAAIVLIAVGTISCGPKTGSHNQSGANGNTEITQGAKITQGAQVTQGATLTQSPTGTQGIAVGEQNGSNIGSSSSEKGRDNSAAVLTALNTGSFTVGTDIPPGRYVITGEGTGNLFINDTSGIPYINEILGKGDLGVSSVTTDLADKDTIQISGLKKAVFTPIKTEVKKDALTTGNWVVGLDIPAGRYDVASSDGNGNFIVYDENGLPVINEILGGGDIGVDKVTVDLKDGNKISISGIDEVKFTAK